MVNPVVRADGKAAAAKALREGRAVAPAGEDGQPSIAVRATDYTSWVQDSPAYEVTYEQVRGPLVDGDLMACPQDQSTTMQVTCARAASLVIYYQQVLLAWMYPLCNLFISNFGPCRGVLAKPGPRLA